MFLTIVQYCQLLRVYAGPCPGCDRGISKIFCSSGAQHPVGKAATRANKAGWVGKHRDGGEYMDNPEKVVMDPHWAKGEVVWEVSPRRWGLCLVWNMVRTQVFWLISGPSTIAQGKAITIQNPKTKPILQS